MSYRLLVAEDDPDIIEILRLYLENEGYEIVSSGNGEEALTMFKNMQIDLAIVDIMMPKMDGLTFIKTIRKESNIPIIILSARNMDQDKIAGLSMGADDYLTKPFNPLEVVARVRSSLRRYFELNMNKENDSQIVTVGELSLEKSAFMLKKNDAVITLTPTEYKIIALLMQSPGKIFTKMQILKTINGDYFQSDDNTLMVHISKIRDKIEKDPKNPEYLKTVRGLGYKIEKK